eukprot:3579434-Rhodomonas_salina.1
MSAGHRTAITFAIDSLRQLHDLCKAPVGEEIRPNGGTGVEQTPHRMHHTGKGLPDLFRDTMLRSQLQPWEVNKGVSNQDVAVFLQGRRHGHRSSIRKPGTPRKKTPCSVEAGKSRDSSA